MNLKWEEYLEGRWGRYILQRLRMIVSGLGDKNCTAWADSNIGNSLFQSFWWSIHQCCKLWCSAYHYYGNKYRYHAEQPDAAADTYTSARFPPNCPTISRSAAPYMVCKNRANSTGKANRISGEKMFPSVKLFVFCIIVMHVNGNNTDWWLNEDTLLIHCKCNELVMYL